MPNLTPKEPGKAQIMARPQGEQTRGEIAGGHAPLDFWLEQEGAPAPDEHPLPLLAAEPAPMPGGWWILPVLVMALPTWGLIIWLFAAA